MRFEQGASAAKVYNHPSIQFLPRTLNVVRSIWKPRDGSLSEPSRCSRWGCGSSRGAPAPRLGSRCWPSARKPSGSCKDGAAAQHGHHTPHRVHPIEVQILVRFSLGENRLHDWQMQRGREEKDFVCQPSRSGSPCSRSNTSANASPRTSAVIHICSLSRKVSLLMVGSIWRRSKLDLLSEPFLACVLSNSQTWFEEFDSTWAVWCPYYRKWVSMPYRQFFCFATVDTQVFH